MRFSLPLLLTCVLFASATQRGVIAQDAGDEPQEVVIERIAVNLKDADVYRVPLTLKARTELSIPATADGSIQSVFVKQPTASLASQAEVVRINSDERLKEQSIAEAGLDVAKAELAAAEGAVKQVAQAKVAVAERELELAQLRVQQTIIRAPFDAEVAEIYVTEGQFVRAGQDLVRIIDPQQLVTHVPVERSNIKVNDTIELTVEDQTVTGKVEAILPATERFGKLQDLFLSVADAQVVIDNSAGKLRPGQAVFSEMIPRHPIMEVPTSAVKNGEDGERKVQVIREGFVRDIPVQLLGQIGETHVFVSGRFTANDELVVSASEELAAGSFIQSVLGAAQQQSASPKRGTPTRTIAPGGRSAVPGGPVYKPGD